MHALRLATPSFVQYNSVYIVLCIGLGLANHQHKSFTVSSQSMKICTSKIFVTCNRTVPQPDLAGYEHFFFPASQDIRSCTISSQPEDNLPTLPAKMPSSIIRQANLDALSVEKEMPAHGLWTTWLVTPNKQRTSLQLFYFCCDDSVCKSCTLKISVHKCHTGYSSPICIWGSP